MPTSCGACAWVGTRTGISWLNEELPTIPAMAGVAAIPPAATAAAPMSKNFFTMGLLRGRPVGSLPGAGDHPLLRESGFLPGGGQ